MKSSDLNDVYELFLAALTIWREARGEPFSGKLGVWNVIKNRVKLGCYGGKDLIGVLTKPKQFSCHNAGDPNSVLFPREGDPSWIACLELVVGDYPENTGGATHYFNYKVCDPKWSKTMVKTAEYGNHVFYKEIRT